MHNKNTLVFERFVVIHSNYSAMYTYVPQQQLKRDMKYLYLLVDIIPTYAPLIIIYIHRLRTVLSGMLVQIRMNTCAVVRDAGENKSIIFTFSYYIQAHSQLAYCVCSLNRIESLQICHHTLS